MLGRREGQCVMLGSTKDIIYKGGEYIYKYFKKKKKLLSLEEQQQLLQRKQQYFGKYIPPTSLESTENGYYIKQKFIKGTLLKDISIHSLSITTLEQLTDLIPSYLQYCNDYHQPFDIIGYQENLINNIWISRLYNILHMCDNFLNSSNIIIDTEGNVFLIDICECHMTRSKKMHSIRTDILKPFVIRNLNKLNTLIQKKKKELFFTLNT